MVGLRVFDIGALIVWLVWFFKLRDDEDDEGGGGPGRPGPAAGPMRPSVPDADPWPGGGATISATGPRRRDPRVRASPRTAPQRGRISSFD